MTIAASRLDDVLLFPPAPELVRALGAEIGVPLLHPWANRLSADSYRAAGRTGRVPAGVPRDGRGLAIHGFASDGWERDGHRAVLDFAPVPAFPYGHRLTVEVERGEDSLAVTALLEATAGVPVPVAFGFHPYLRLPDVPRRAWEVTLPAMRRLELDLDGIPAGRAWWQHAQREPLGLRAFDDCFDALPDGAEFRLAGGGREVVVRFERGFGTAQVFAPLEMDVVCFEPMTAPVDALVSGRGLPVVEPGGAYSARFSVTAR